MTKSMLLGLGASALFIFTSMTLTTEAKAENMTPQKVNACTTAGINMALTKFNVNRKFNITPDSLWESIVNISKSCHTDPTRAQKSIETYQSDYIAGLTKLDY